MWIIPDKQRFKQARSQKYPLYSLILNSESLLKEFPLFSFLRAVDPVQFISLDFQPKIFRKINKNINARSKMNRELVNEYSSNTEDLNTSQDSTRLAIIFQQAKRICKPLQNQSENQKLIRLKNFYGPLLHTLNRPYLNESSLFVGTLCIFVYLMRSHPEIMKSSKLLKCQFYDNLSLVLMDVYQTYEITQENTQKRLAYTTLVKVILEMHSQSSRLRKKLLNDKVIEVVYQLKAPKTYNLLHDLIKLNISCQYFSTVQQRIALNVNLVRYLAAEKMDRRLSQQILNSIESTGILAEIPKDSLIVIFKFIKIKILQASNENEELGLIVWFYLKNSNFCPKQKLQPSELPRLIEKFRTVAEQNKKLIQKVIENLSFSTKDDHLVLVKNFLNAKEREKQIYLSILIRSFPKFSSVLTVPLANSDFFDILDFIQPNTLQPEAIRLLVVQLYQKIIQKFREANQRLAWVIQQRLQLYKLKLGGELVSDETITLQ